METNQFSKIKVEKVNDLHFLCNYENGSIVYLEEQYLEEVNSFLQDQSIENLSEGTKNVLAECGFFDEADKVIGQAYIHVTDRCNMDCIGCYSRTSLRNVRKDMDLDDIKNILNQLKKHNIFRIVISGGEPLMRKDISEIIEYAKGIGFEVAMISNGSYLIPGETMKNLDYLSFSVDVLDERKNRLNRVMCKENLIKNLETAKEYQVYVNGIVTINAFNIDTIDQYFAMKELYDLPITFSIFHATDEVSKPFLLKDEQLRKLVDQCVGELPELIEGFSSFDDIYCRENCGAGKCNISVDASGNLSPCHMLHNINIGNLLDDEEKAWDDLDKFWKSLCTPSECAGCDYYAFCGAGCKARALLTGDGKGKDPYCEMYRYYYEKQYRYIKDVLIAN